MSISLRGLMCRLKRNNIITHYYYSFNKDIAEPLGNTLPVENWGSW